MLISMARDQETDTKTDPPGIMDLTLDAMRKENIFQATDFSKAWASSDAIFVVEEQKLHVHRWVLSRFSPVFDKMFSSNFLEKSKTEIALPGKKHDEFQVLMLMVYSLAERPITIENCFYLLKLADEYQMEFLLQKCEDFLVAASGAICAGRMSIKEYFPDFLPEQSKAAAKEQVLTLIILAQEYKLERLITACIHEARHFSLKELKQDYEELCDLLESINYCRILEEIIERMEGRFCVFWEPFLARFC